MEEEEKRWKKDIEKTQADLESRGRLFSGEAIKLLGRFSPYPLPGTPEAEKSQIPTQQPLPDGTFINGEVNDRHDAYIKHRNQQFKLDKKRAKYLVLVSILKRLIKY